MSGPDACAAALAGLPGMGPANLVRLLAAHGPSGAWDLVCSGAIEQPEAHARSRGAARPAAPVSTNPSLPWDDPELHQAATGSARPDGTDRRVRWMQAARSFDPERSWEACRREGIQVTWWGADTFPVALRRDPQPPGVLFWRGDLGWLERPCVALVGTRRPTPDGRSTAFQLGRDLASAGVCVVSGLALGIDGSAHAGALSVEGTGTVGVAASGVDVVYPARHADLWRRVVEQGAVCSETPPGRPAQAWRFPARNRVIAGLCRLVVVVESHVTGGSLITAEAALARGIDVAAVPGPVRSPASVGSNQLLTEGPAPVRHAGDVLDLLGRVAPWPPPGMHLRPSRLAPVRSAPSTPSPSPPSPSPPSPSPPSPSPPSPPSPEPGSGGVEQLAPHAYQVLQAVPWRQATLNHIVDQAGLPLGVVAAALDDLDAAGLVSSAGSWWYRTEPSARAAGPV